MKENKDEYLMLREEILHIDTIINNIIAFFYAFIAAYLSFNIKETDTIYILILYIVIIPAYSLVVHKMRNMAAMGAYLAVFHEGKIFNWENRHIKYLTDTKPHVSSPNVPFIFVNLAMFVLFLYKTDWSSVFSCYERSYYECVKVFCGCVLFMLTFWLIKRNRVVLTRDCIEKWEKLKEAEASKKND